MMDEEIDRLVIGVRADTAAFARDVEAMRAALDGPLEAGAARAGRAIEGALTKAVRTGKLEMDDLKRAALEVMAEIAAAAMRDGLNALLGGIGGSGSGGLAGALGGLIGGAPGRATGGPVGPGRAYLVGERGPELFVPTASGRVVPDLGRAGRAAREVRVAITVNAGAGVSGPEALTRSSRQVVRAVRAALSQE